MSIANNEWLRYFLPREESIESELNKSEPAASSSEELQRFRQAVLNNLSLQQQLRETDDRESFITLLVGVGQQLGYHFTAADVDDALRAEQQAWFERWIV